MHREGILFRVSTFTMLTVLTNVLVSVFATRSTVTLVQEGRVAFLEDKVAGLRCRFTG